MDRVLIVDSFRVIGFDHRKSVLAQIKEDHPKKVTFYTDLEKSSSTAVHEYFSSKLVEMNPVDVGREIPPTLTEFIEVIM